MSKVVLKTLASGYNSTTLLNSNFDKITTGFENTLSRDGTGPNTMSSVLDMNSNRIINSGVPSAAGDVVNKGYVDSIIGTLDPASGSVIAQAVIDAQAAASTAVAAATQASADAAAAEAAVASLGTNPSAFLVTATGTTTARTLANRFSENGRILNLLDFGVDNTGVTNVRDVIQSVLDMSGQTYQTTIVVPSGDYLIGTNELLNVQDILYYKSNTTILVYGNLIHNTNSGNQHILASYNVANDAGARYSNVHIHFLGGKVKFSDTARLAGSRKGLNISFTDTFSVSGYRTEGDNSGSFTAQCRSSTQGVILGSIMNSGDGQGEDGWHLTRNCSDIIMSGLSIRSGDDSISLTQENGGGPYIMENITINGCIALTSNNSSFKVYVDSTSALLGSKIRGINYIGGSLGLTGKVNSVGTLIRIEAGLDTDNAGVLDAVSDINVVGVNVDNRNPAGDGALTSTSARLSFCSRVAFKNCKFRNSLRNAILVQGGKDFSIQNCEFFAPQAQTTTTNLTGLTVTSMVRSSTSVIATFSGSPDLSTIAGAPTFTSITIPTGTGMVNASNTGTFSITAVDNTAKTATLTVNPRRQTSTDDETSVTVTGVYIRKQAGECINFSGGKRHRVEGCTFHGSTTGSDGRVIAFSQGINCKQDTRYTTTSTTSHDITTGAKTFTIGGSRNFYPGGTIKIVQTSNTANILNGTVTTYAGNTTIVVNITSTSGSGTGITDWTFSADQDSVPTGLLVRNNNFVDWIQECAVNLQQCKNSFFEANRAIDCGGRVFISEGSSALSGNNRFFNNIDESDTPFRTSYSFAQSTSVYKSNRGNNSDLIRFAVSIPDLGTAATILIPDGVTTASTLSNISSVSGGWTKGFGASIMSTRHLRLVPTSAQAGPWHVGYNSGTRVYTITLHTAASGSAATFDGILSTESD